MSRHPDSPAAHHRRLQVSVVSQRAEQSERRDEGCRVHFHSQGRVVEQQARDDRARKLQAGHGVGKHAHSADTIQRLPPHMSKRNEELTRMGGRVGDREKAKNNEDKRHE